MKKEKDKEPMARTSDLIEDETEETWVSGEGEDMELADPELSDGQVRKVRLTKAEKRALKGKEYKKDKEKED